MPRSRLVWLNTVSAATTPSSPLGMIVFRFPCVHRTAGLEPTPPACQNQGDQWGTALKTPRTLTEGQRAYEAKRAAKAGMSLEKWLNSKQRQQEAETRAKEKAVVAAKPPKKPGLFSRLLERAQKPL
jgi:hypothetical protein